MLITLNRLNSDIHSGGWQEVDVFVGSNVSFIEDDPTNGGSIIHFNSLASNASTGSSGAGLIVKETRAEIRALVNPTIALSGLGELVGHPEGTLIS